MKKTMKKMGLIILTAALLCSTIPGAYADESATPSEATPVATAEPTVEPTAEPTVAPTAEPVAEPTAEPTVEPTAEPAPVAFTGVVKVKLETEGDLFFGDTVTLRADVRDANAEYAIRWEMKSEEPDAEWEVIPGETAETYSFAITEENADYAYRAVLVVAE